MAHKKNISNLLKRYVLDECTKEEIEILITYFQKGKGQEEMPTVEQVLNLLKEQKNVISPSFEYSHLEILKTVKKKEQLRVNSRKTKFLTKWRRYAFVASFFIGALASGYLLWKDYTIENKLVIPENAITLELGDGSIEILELDGNKELYDKVGSLISKKIGSKLSYENNINIVDKLTYNKLTVPYGKQFTLELSDGTDVKLNAGTSIKYPVRFIKGKDRLVFLSGEAFFDVSHDKEHPFIVNSGQLNTRVLGTRFNVSSYPEDDRVNVVLVEGKVGLHLNNEDYSKDCSVILKPGYMGSYNKENEYIDAHSVITDIYTSWKVGELIFRNVLFKNMLKKLERHYDVSITNRNEIIDNERFNASYGVVKLDKILEDLKITYGIKYTIESNKILIE